MYSKMGPTASNSSHLPTKASFPESSSPPPSLFSPPLPSLLRSHLLSNHLSELRGTSPQSLWLSPLCKYLAVLVKLEACSRHACVSAEFVCVSSAPRVYLWLRPMCVLGQRGTVKGPARIQWLEEQQLWGDYQHMEETVEFRDSRWSRSTCVCVFSTHPPHTHTPCSSWTHVAHAILD